MNVDIRYKVIDKKVEVNKIITEAINNYKGYAPHCEIRHDAYANRVEAIYKEDSKQIESVEIKRKDIKIIVCGQLISMTHTSKVGYQTYAISKPFNKSELSQYIDILTTIKNQMEG